MNSLEKYEDIFMQIFEIERRDVRKLVYQDATDWDSVGHMNLIAAVEEEFDISMSPDDIIDFNSFDQGIEILKNYGIYITSK